MDFAGIDPEKGQLAREGVGNGLEDKGAERLIPGDLSLYRLFRSRVDAFDLSM